eukprot:27398-Alexandrium_andersonii.AAC.1
MPHQAKTTGRANKEMTPCTPILEEQPSHFLVPHHEWTHEGTRDMHTKVDATLFSSSVQKGRMGMSRCRVEAPNSPPGGLTQAPRQSPQ